MKKKNILKYIPALMVLTLPFIVKKTSYNNRFRDFTWSSDSRWMTDDFLIYKAAALLLFVLLSGVACFVQWRRSRESRVKQKIYWEWIVYLVAVALSTVFSRYPVLSLMGANDQFESVWILAAYVGIAFFTSRLLSTGADRELLYRATACMASVMGVAGIVQFLALKQKIYLTLYNPNYVGMMMAMIFPALYMRLWEKDIKKWKLLYSLGTSGAVICLVLSGSKGAIIISVWLFVLFLVRQYGAGVWSILFLSGSLAIGFAGFVWMSAGKDAGKEHFPANVVTGSDCVSFESKNGALNIQFTMPDEEHYLFTLTDETGKHISYTENEEGTRYLPADERFAGFEFTIADYDGSYGFLVEVDGREWYFARLDNGEYGYMNGYFHLEQFRNAPHIMFAGREEFATNRGYIWSRTLPVLPETIWFGTGPDTFAAVFPQNDVGKYLLTDMPYKMIVTRPHNFFLQTAVQTGALSLAAMLYGFWRVLRMLLRNRERKEAHAIAFALCAYLLSGLFYDSSLCVAPVFWLFFGAGISVCRECGTD